jgi:hypothetical protein
MGALVSAEHNAANYPGGPKQFMQDWLHYSKTGQAPPAVRQVEFAKVEMQNFIDDNKAIMYMPDGPIKERTVLQRAGPLASTGLPFLRAQIQQMRYFASLADDMGEAVAKGDLTKASQALGAILLGHIQVATIAGSHVVPDYGWAIMQSIDKEKADQLRDAIDEGQEWVVTGGGNVPYVGQVQDFGLKWLPYLRRPESFVVQKGEQTLGGAPIVAKVAMGKKLTESERKQYLNAVVNTLAFGIIGRIGPQGTLNLGYLANRIQMAQKGKQEYKVYEEAWRQAVGHRLLPKMLAEKNLPYDIVMALIQWFVKLETPDEMAVRRKAEGRAEKQLKRDIRKRIGSG